MKRYADCPQVLREFLIYHENMTFKQIGIFFNKRSSITLY